MSYMITSTAGKTKQGLNEYTCETVADLDKIPKSICSFGDVAIVMATGDVYMCDSKKEWHII